MKHRAHIRTKVAAAVAFCAPLLVLAALPAAANGVTGPDGGQAAGNCANQDGALNDAAFVIAELPHAGDRVESGFSVLGCSRTFESMVQWRLIGRKGNELAKGFTQGGGVDGPGEFSFTVTYSLDAREIGHLEVFEEDVSGGEGNPPGRTVLPLVLKP